MKCKLLKEGNGILFTAPSQCLEQCLHLKDWQIFVEWVNKLFKVFIQKDLLLWMDILFLPKLNYT